MATQGYTDAVTLTAAAEFSRFDTVSYAVLSSVAGTNTITATGPANYAYAATTPPVWFIPAATNTGATTINITPSGGAALGAKNIFFNGAACIGGELTINVPVGIVYDGTQFNIVGFASFARGTTASTWTFNGSGGTSSSVTMTWQKIGNFVTLHIPVVTATTGTGSTTFTSNTALPAAIRPLTTTQTTAINGVLDNGAVGATAGVITLTTAGILTLRRTGTGTAWTNAATGGTNEGNSLTYFVGTGS